MIFEKPHIKLLRKNGQLLIEVDTWELKDFLEDYLNEKYNIDYDYFEELNSEKEQISYESYRLFFSSKYSENQLIRILEKLNDNQLTEIVKFQRIQSKAKFYCPCCGYNTLNQPPNRTYNICNICFWEDDLIQLNNPDSDSGANRVSLNQAKKNF